MKAFVAFCTFRYKFRFSVVKWDRTRERITIVPVDCNVGKEITIRAYSVPFATKGVWSGFHFMVPEGHEKIAVGHGNDGGKRACKAFQRRFITKSITILTNIVKWKSLSLNFVYRIYDIYSPAWNNWISLWSSLQAYFYSMVIRQGIRFLLPFNNDQSYFIISVSLNRSISTVLCLLVFSIHVRNIKWQNLFNFVLLFVLPYIGRCWSLLQMAASYEERTFFLI